MKVNMQFYVAIPYFIPLDLDPDSEFGSGAKDPNEIGSESTSLVIITPIGDRDIVGITM